MSKAVLFMSDSYLQKNSQNRISGKKAKCHNVAPIDLNTIITGFYDQLSVNCWLLRKGESRNDVIRLANSRFARQINHRAKRHRRNSIDPSELYPAPDGAGNIARHD